MCDFILRKHKKKFGICLKISALKYFDLNYFELMLMNNSNKGEFNINLNLPKPNWITNKGCFFEKNLIKR